MLLRHKIVVKLNKRRQEPNNRGKNQIFLDGGETRLKRKIIFPLKSEIECFGSLGQVLISSAHSD